MTIQTMPAPSAATPASRRTSHPFADPALLIAAATRAIRQMTMSTLPSFNP